MAREKKAKVRSMKPKKSFKERASSFLFAIISLAVAAVLFVGLLFLQNYFAEDITYREVIVASVDIPEGEIITEENFGKYFGTSNINVLNSTVGALSREDAEKLINMKSRVSLQKGEIVTLKDFQDLNVYLDSIENPIEISIAVDSMASSDGGKIRAGDLVNITLMFTKGQLQGEPSNVNVNLVPTQPVTEPVDGEETEETEEKDYDDMTTEEKADYLSDIAGLKPGSYYVDDANAVAQNVTVNGTDTKLSVYQYDAYSQYVLENIYVSKVLASDGSVIEPTDTESTAAIFIFIIPKAMELELNNALENCTSMRVSKILYSYTPSEDAVSEDVEDTVNTETETSEEVQETPASSENTESTEGSLESSETPAEGDEVNEE